MQRHKILIVRPVIAKLIKRNINSRVFIWIKVCNVNEVDSYIPMKCYWLQLNGIDTLEVADFSLLNRYKGYHRMITYIFKAIAMPALGLHNLSMIETVSTIW